jgi:hypothetical protein
MAPYPTWDAVTLAPIAPFSALSQETRRREILAGRCPDEKKSSLVPQLACLVFPIIGVSTAIGMSLAFVLAH